MSDSTVKLPPSALPPPNKFRVRTAETVPALRLCNIGCFKHCGSNAMVLFDVGNTFVSSEVALCKMDARELITELERVIGPPPRPEGTGSGPAKTTRAKAMEIVEYVERVSRGLRGPRFAFEEFITDIQKILEKEG